MTDLSNPPPGVLSPIGQSVRRREDEPFLTGADLAEAKVGGLPCGWLIQSKDGSPMNEPLKIIAKGKKIAAHLLEAAHTDIEFENGVFKVAGTDKSLQRPDRRPGLQEYRDASHYRTSVARCKRSLMPTP